MRRHSSRWPGHRALLGVCVLLQSFSSLTAQVTVSTDVSQSTLIDSAGQTSSETSSTNSPATTQENLKPDVVTSLTISDRTTTSVSLTWNSPQGNSSFYRVEWTDGNLSNNASAISTYYTVTNLTPGGNYTFTVTAVAADGVSAGAPTQISAFTKPDVVTNLTISDRTTTSVSLTWNSQQGNSSFYRVEWTDGNLSNNASAISMSYTVTNLTPGGNYTFTVTAVAADGVSAGAPTQISAFTKPDVVTNLTISDRTTTSVSLTWNSPQRNSSFYRVEWTDGNLSNNASAISTSYTVTNLTPGGNYTFTVTAVAADGVSAGAPTQISAFTKPDVVTNLTISDRTTTSVSLTWNSPQRNSSFYRVEWTDGNLSNNASAISMSYTVTNLTPGGNYIFTVTAVAADGVSAGAPTQISAFTKPDVVTSLTISDRTTTSVSLTWNSPQGNSSFYRVEWTDGNLSNNASAISTSYTVTNLTPGGNYIFTVTAVAADGEIKGAPTQISAFTKPDVVTNLTISDRTTTSVSLTWNSPQGNRSFYRVEWTDGNLSNNASAISMSYTVTNLTPGGNYTFTVTAVAADGVSAGAPTQISAFAKPDVVTSLTISDRTTTSVSLTWNSPQGNSSFYRVEWTDGNLSNNASTISTYYTVTNLTPGGNYTFTVTAVAADGVTAGAPTQISAFTIPDVVSNLSVSDKNTSSVFLTWTLQHGHSSFYSVQWTGGSANPSPTSYMATNLTAGVNYTFSVTAVAADKKTTGATTQISTFTSKSYTIDTVMFLIQK
ncbi:hypothetical protein AOLI_G00184670 [Acnodon oligacanthus]